MKLKNRQLKFVEALAAAGCVSPVSRQELIAVCDSSGIYTCPPSWITQDSTRKAGRGEYNLPELNEVSGEVPPAPVQDTADLAAPSPVQGAVESITPESVASLALGMTAGERQTLVPDRFDGYVAWGHFKDIEKIVRSSKFRPIFVTGLSGNGKTLMVEQVCA